MASVQSKNGLCTCPCCGYATLDSGANYEICKICFWEDDGQDEADADENMGGPNYISLTTGRMNYLLCGASDPKDLPHCRKANEDDEKLRHFTLVGDRIIESKTIASDHKNQLS